MSDPKPVASAGACCWRGDEIVLIRRGKPPYAGRWSIPGGKVRFGETVRQAALRELYEETGLSAEIVGLIDVVDSVTEAGHHVLIDFAMRWTGGEPRAADDALEAAFFPMERALELTDWDETRVVIRASRAMLDAAAP